MAADPAKTGWILSTAGAVPVKNEKGEVSMKKVKVTRYVAGKRPDYAEGEYSEAESSGEEEAHIKAPEASVSRWGAREGEETENMKKDPRMRRIQQFKRDAKEEEDDSDDDVRSRRRRVVEPEVVSSRRSVSPERPSRERGRRHRSPESSEDEEDDVSDDEFEKRRQLIKDRIMRKQQEEEELLGKQEEEQDSSGSEEEEESEEDEDSSSEEDEAVPRLKPIFVRKRDRVTLQETERQEQRMKELELEEKKAAEERKRASAKLVEQIVKTEVEMEKKKVEDSLDLNSVSTDDENEEVAYESWKLRELKRIKRDKEEREALEKEKAELERIHSMTEEERRAFLRANPKLITNKQHKGKYKFMQKYFHRGVFFLDEEDQVYGRNFAEPTLEDHFDKTILPKVMQVKDFGKAGRTKWTHLVAEDTTDFQSAWVSDTAQNMKFFHKHGGGVKDVFERPAAKKKKK